MSKLQLQDRLSIFVDSEEPDTVQLWHFGQEDDEQRYKIDHKVARIVLRVHASEQEPALKFSTFSQLELIQLRTTSLTR